MTTQRTNDFIELVKLSVTTETLKKLVLSRPKESEIAKISGRLCSHRERRILALEYSLPGNTVSHKNLGESEIEQYLAEALGSYMQANLITTEGECEWKISRSGKEALLGADKLKKRLSGEREGFESAIEALDKRKNYLLSGNEDFLIALGISDATGRVHDKKQAKYRQINRFLEHIEDIYPHLPKEGTLNVYDLCCGKSYLSFAVYYYLTARKSREVRMLGIDLKRDVISWCEALAKRLGYTGMSFIYDDVKNTPRDTVPDMVISLHACDIATDIVLDTAVELGARVILSTPCCQRYLSSKIDSLPLSFVTRYPHLKMKLSEVLTDALRAAHLTSRGYSVGVLELTDPENTPKNTLIRAIKSKDSGSSEEYDEALKFLLGDGAKYYLKEIK